MKASGILVIGRGFIGTTVGYGLAELGAQVNLLDQGGKYAECFTGKFWTCLGAEQSTWYAALCGMGLCQGRMCALTVADIIADTHGKHRRKSDLFMADHLSYRSLWEGCRKVQTDEV
ncbi:hypothetical protein OAJ98_02780 [Deltaproteobacteria bacterium]|nr:hypothetical protein [Deltaproteobacteria bacterium]